MKIALAQADPLIGGVEENIKNHISLIDRVLAYHVDWIIFPELSLTGYVPELAEKLATSVGDARFDVFQGISDDSGISIAVGMPLRNDGGLNIALLCFQRGEPRSAFAKRYLHEDEEPWFGCGSAPFQLLTDNPRIALAICYEISVDAHLAEVQSSSAEIYIASVVKSSAGTSKAHQRLSSIAKSLSVPALMVNSIGQEDGATSGGRSAAWNRNGELIGELASDKQGVLVVDTVREEIVVL